jgi:hypothetical protein
VRGLARRALTAFAIGACALLASCATLPPTPEERAAFGTVAVQVAEAPPEVDFDPPVTGWGAGLGMGAVRGLGVIVAAPVVAVGAIGASGANPGQVHGGSGGGDGVATVVFVGAVVVIAEALAVLWFPCSVVGGAVTAPAPETIDAAEPVVRGIVEDPGLRDALGRGFESTVRHALGREPVDPSGATTILEIRLLTVQRGRSWNLWTFDRPFEVTVRASARVIRRSDGCVLWEDTMESSTGKLVHTYAEWAADGGAPLRAALDGLLADLAGRFAHVILLAPGEDAPASAPGRTEEGEGGGSGRGDPIPVREPAASAPPARASSEPPGPSVLPSPA